MALFPILPDMEIQNLLTNNKEWAAQMLSLDPDFFSRLEHQQRPKFLWIGCSDSRVPANLLTGLPPGEVFVHRNIANLVIHTDFNALSVIQYAIEQLEIEHIIVCGHYGCNGIRAAMGQRHMGFVDNWLRHIKDIQSLHSDKLLQISEPQEQENQLTEWNVMHQVANVACTSFVEHAWDNGQKLSIHGWVYSVADGLIRDLGVNLRKPADLPALLERIGINR